MTELVWAALQQDDRFLLIQQLANHQNDYNWSFPWKNFELGTKTPTQVIATELKKSIGLNSKRLRKLYQIRLDQYCVQGFLCDQWNGEFKITYKQIIGMGWFTLAEIHSLSHGLVELLNQSLPYFTYIYQHYMNHPNEWKDQWQLTI